MEQMTIGRLAREADVSTDTVRFYERKGLLSEVARSESGYRQYGEEAVQRLKFIRRAKALGFTLGEISDLLDLNTNDHESCKEAGERAERTIARIDAQIAELGRMRDALGDLVEACRTRTPLGDCPILHTLEASEN